MRKSTELSTGSVLFLLNISFPEYYKQNSGFFLKNNKNKQAEEFLTMPKSDLNAAVEKISERIAKRVLRACKAFGTMGTWIKALQDDNRMLKKRIQ